MGIISQDYKFNKPLDKYQKGVITKKMLVWGHVIKHPELFHIQKVGKVLAKSLSRTEYKVSKSGRAAIPLREYTSAKINGKDFSITFKNRRGLESTEHISESGKGFLDKLLGLSKSKLPPNKMVTIKIGDRSPISLRFTDYGELYKYLTRDFKPKDKGATLESLLPIISVVTIPMPKASIVKKSAKQIATKKKAK